MLTNVMNGTPDKFINAGPGITRPNCGEHLVSGEKNLQVMSARILDSVRWKTSRNRSEARWLKVMMNCLFA